MTFGHVFIMKNIKAILFDLDGTLRFNNPTGDQVFIQYVLDLGLRISEEDEIRAQRWEHYYFANSPEIQADQEQYSDREKFWINFARRRMVALGCHPRRAQALAPQASAYMAENYKPQTYVPEEIFPLLASIKECGYVLGVVSNRDDPFHDELKELKLDPYFKFSLAGGEVDSFKPDPRIFEQALERSGTSAIETIYIGDNYFADIIGARRAGLVPVLLDPAGLFPEADCAVIKSFHEFPELLM
jgi:putative hydrolase of the HAD superfamily